MPKNISVEEILATTDPVSRVAALTFEEGIELLDELVGTVESGSMSLERSILSYERGMLLIDQLKKRLDGAEERLKQIREDESEVDVSTDTAESGTAAVGKKNAGALTKAKSSSTKATPPPDAEL